MSKFNNFPTGDLTKITKAYDSARKGLTALGLEIGRGTHRGTKFDTNFQKYFGKVEKEGMTYAVDAVKAMQAKIASLTFQVFYDANYTSGNAMMSSYTSYDFTALKSIATIGDIQNWETTQMNTGGSKMTIGPSCMSQEMWKQDDQCIIESFLHELSHHAAGTVDDTNGGDCYGLSGVNRLKALGSARSTRNAENVAFFCMCWVGRVT